MSEQPVQPDKPEPPDPLVKDTRAFWQGVGRTLVRGSIGAIDEAAKQIIGVAGILEGLYFHAVAFSGLRGNVGGWLLAAYAAPVVLLMVSLGAALAVYFPSTYDINIHSSGGSHDRYNRILQSKMAALRVAAAFLVLGVAAILLAVLLYLGGQP